MKLDHNFLAEFSPDAVKHNLILYLMISRKLNDKVVQTSQYVIVYTRSVQFMRNVSEMRRAKQLN